MNIITTALATARLTSLIAEDELTAPLRGLVIGWAEAQPENRLRDRLAYLVSCSRCVSVWAAAAVLAAQLTPFTRPLVTALALSQEALSVLALHDAVDRHQA